MVTNKTEKINRESPEYVRMSLAAAMTLGFKQGLFYRNARLYCVNLLLTYDEGCRARCAYCGLSQKRPGAYKKKSFIRVSWPSYPLEEIIDRISKRQDRVKRICISMITNTRSVQNTKDICKKLRTSFDIPVSLLITPTILTYDDLKDFKAAGADKIGVAIDLATEDLFGRFRGTGIEGPHRWETYWSYLEHAIEIFGKGNAGSHFMVGMGESERDMCEAIQRVKDMGGHTHLFSFFPESGSSLSNHEIPSMDHYRRIQLARFLIDNERASAWDFHYSDQGTVEDFQMTQHDLDSVIASGEPFRTSGCTGYDGEVACNRPFANSRPGPDIRNYPFPPNKEDIARIQQQCRMGSSFLTG